MKEITLDATIENIETVTNFVNEFLEEHDCSPKAQIQLDVAIDELFSNIAHYAYAPKVGKATVSIDYNDKENSISISFSDSGIPYNPLEKADPDTTLSASERQIGGLGIFMVKKSMDGMRYEYKDGKNNLIIEKKI